MKKSLLFVLFLALGKGVEGKAPIFSPIFSTLTSHQLQIGTPGVDSLPSVVIYDLNNDGRKDLLVGDRDGNIRFYPNLPPPPPLACSDYFSTYTLLTYNSDTESIIIDVGEEAKPQITDWNRDGISDLLVGCSDGSVFLFLGTTTYIDSGSYFLSPEKLNVKVKINSAPIFSDFDEDGARDLLIGDGLGKVWWFRNLGFDDAPSFGTVGNEVLVGSLSLDVGENAVPYFIDWDGDGIKDLIVGDNLGYIWFFKQNPATGTSRSFQEGKRIKAACGEIDVGFRASPFVCDFDGNGGYDLIVGESGGSIDIFLNTKKVFAEPPDFNLPYKMPGPSLEINEGREPAIFVCDYDGDKRDDLLIGTNKGEVYLYRNIGETMPMFNGGFPLYMTWGTESIPLDVGYNAVPFVYDLGGDGKKDLICGNSEGYVLFFKNIGSDDAPLFGSPTYLTSGDAPIDVGFNSAPYLADLDRDGRIDLLVGDSLGEVWFFAGSTTTSFKSGTRLSVPSGNINVGGLAKPWVVDWNADGFLDLLVGSKERGGFLFLNQGTFSFREGRQILSEGLSLAYADFAEDTRKDLLVGFSSGYIGVFPSIGETSLRLNLSADKRRVDLLKEVTYTLILSNEGNIEANNIVVKASLPENTTWVSGGGYDPIKREVSFTLPWLGGEATEIFTFTISIELDYPSDNLTLIAQVESNEEIVHLFSNPVSLMVDRLVLTKKVDKTLSYPGATLTYTLVARNYSSNATNVKIVDTLPGSTFYLPGSSYGTGGIEYSIDGIDWFFFETSPVNYIRWTIESLNQGQSGSLTFSVRIPNEIPDGTIIENIATIITGIETEPKTSSVKTLVSSLPILTLKKSVDLNNSTTYPGGTLTYILDYTNSLKEATNVCIIDTLPTETTYLSSSYPSNVEVWYSHDGINYDQNPINPITHIKWIIGSLNPGITESIILSVRIRSEVKDGTIITNKASIKSDEVGEIQTKAVIYIVSKPDFSQSTITSTPSGPVSSGWFIKYKINYRNTGNEVANGVSIKVDLDNRLIVNTIEGGTITQGFILFNIGTIGIGENGIRRFSCFVKKPILSQETIAVSAEISGSNFEKTQISTFLPLVPPIDSESNEWPMLGFNLAHSGYNPKEFVIPQEIGLFGSISLSGQIFGQPIINRGRIYIGCKETLYSLDKEGNILWSFPALVYSTPAIASDKIFFTTEDGYLSCLDEQGNLIFSVYIGPQPTSPAIMQGIVYVASQKCLFAISAFTGDILWSYPDIDGNIYTSPAISNGLVYIGTDKGNIYSLDAYTGELKLVASGYGKIYSSLTIDKDIAYFGGNGIYGIKQSGTMTSNVLNLSLGSPINSIPAIYNDTLYIGGDNGRLYAISLGSPTTIKWEFVSGGRIREQCAIANVLFFTSEDGYLYCLNPDNGDLLFKYNIGIGRGVSLADGRIYAISENRLWMFENAPSLYALISSNPKNMISSGGTITYTISYKNKGRKKAQEAALDLWINDCLVQTWDLGTIPENYEGIVTYDYPAPFERMSKIRAYANLRAANHHLVKTKVMENIVGEKANPGLEIKPNITTATLQDEIGYTILYKNLGDFPLNHLNVIVNKPDWTTYIPNSTRHNGIPQADIQGLSPIFLGISIPSLGGLANGSITFKLKVNPDCPNGERLETQGILSAQEGSVLASSDILIEAPMLSGFSSVSSPLAKPGDSLGYTIFYENKGKRSAYNLIITEKLSNDLATISAISNNGKHNPLYHTITWLLGELAPGESGSVTFNARLKPVLNNGLIITDYSYIEATNIARFELSSSSLTIESTPNLFATKEVSPKAGVSLGSVITYTISVVNRGNMDASNVIVQDQLSSQLSVSQLRTKGEVIEGEGSLDLDDLNGWMQFRGGIDGIIEITTEKGRYRSSLINTFNYPNIQSLITEINNDQKAGARISYDPIADQFTISKEDGYIIALSEEGSHPFFSAIGIQSGNYCTGSYTNGLISWNLGDLPVNSTKTLSFSAQVVAQGTIINTADITSNETHTTTNSASIIIEENLPVLMGRPIEDANSDNLDDDGATGTYRVIMPLEVEPCGIIEYRLEEKIETGSFSLIATIPVGSLSYEIKGRIKGKSYYYRVKARNSAGWGDYSEISDGIKMVDFAKVILPNVGTVISEDNLKIIIPKDAFSGSVTFTIQRKDIGIIGLSPGISSILKNSVYEFIALPEEYNGSEIQPTKPITLTLPYDDPDPSNEIDDLSYRIYKLVGDKWVLVPGEQIVNPALNTIQCTLNSLSIYGVGSPIGLSLGNVEIKPNPFKGDRHNKIIFYGLNSGKVGISIFNIAGELVFKKEVPGPQWSWNLLNDKGKRVSSGIYFALIDNGKEKIIKRFAIIK